MLNGKILQICWWLYCEILSHEIDTIVSLFKPYGEKISMVLLHFLLQT